MKIILASQSPRRRDYMEKLFGKDGFMAVPSDIPEPFNTSLSFIENAETLALAKAQHVQRQYPDDIVIASDTIVEVDGELLAKAETREEAEIMLKKQLGKKTQVVSSLAVLSPGKQIVTHDVTEVNFKEYEDVKEALENFLDSKEWVGKGGAYAIQGGASPLIHSIRGDICNDIGFPVQELKKIMIKDFGIKTRQLQEHVPTGIVAEL